VDKCSYRRAEWIRDRRPTADHRMGIHPQPRESRSMRTSPSFWWGKACPEAFFFFCTRPCLDEFLQASHGHPSARRGIMLHLAFLVGGTGPTESIAAVAGRVAHLWRAATRARVPLPVPKGVCARRDGKILSERARLWGSYWHSQPRTRRCWSQVLVLKRGRTLALWLRGGDTHLPEEADVSTHTVAREHYRWCSNTVVGRRFE